MSECEKECVFNSNNECWLACKNKFYNQALEDFEKCLIQQSIYTETEEGWSGMTVDEKTIKNIKEQLKKY